MAIDIETHDPDLKKTGIGVRRNGRMIGVSFAIEYDNCPDLSTAPAFYLPFGHEGGDNIDQAQVLAYLKDQASTFRGDIVGANLQYDLDYLLQNGISFKPRFFRDVQIAEPLLYELHFSYSLQNTAERNGFEGKNETHLDQAAKMFGVDSKAGLWKLPARHVGPYAEVDARLPLRLIQVQERRIIKEDESDQRGAKLWDLYGLESRLLPVLLKMRRHGVRIDFDQLDRVEATSIREEEDSLAEMSRLSGVRVAPADINRPTIVARAIETATGVKLPRTSKKQPSIAKDALAPIKHPVVDLYQRARRFNKLRTTFVKSIREHQTNGRVHTSFHQLRREKDNGDEAGAGPGRLSSGDPNLQNQPGQDPEIGPMWRAIYIPDDGAQWACLDFSQQEPRWCVHIAEVLNCVGAKEAANRYRADPKLDNHTLMAELIGWQGKEGRTRAKRIFLGLCYGMGGAKLCREIGLPTEWITTRQGRTIEVAGPEGRAILDEFDHKLPFIREFASRAEAAAKKRGYIKTILGRRCHFEKNKFGGPGYDHTHKAGNNFIQGSSADQVKKAMVDADDAGIMLQLQVHDELDTSVQSPEEADRLAEIMRQAVPCNVPHRIEPKVVANWGLAK